MKVKGTDDCAKNRLYHVYDAFKCRYFETILVKTATFYKFDLENKEQGHA